MIVTIDGHYYFHCIGDQFIEFLLVLVYRAIASAFRCLLVLFHPFISSVIIIFSVVFPLFGTNKVELS